MIITPWGIDIATFKSLRLSAVKSTLKICFKNYRESDNRYPLSGRYFPDIFAWLGMQRWVKCSTCIKGTVYVIGVTKMANKGLNVTRALREIQIEYDMVQGIYRVRSGRLILSWQTSNSEIWISFNWKCLCHAQIPPISALLWALKNGQHFNR